jgi:predicted metal-binding membrane protein
MTTSDAVLVKPRVARAISSGVGQHPELAAALSVLAAWAVLLTTSGHQSMRMGASPVSVWPAAAAGLPSWMLMTVAMMGPAVLPRFRHVGRAAASPVRAVSGFAIGYLAVWAVFGFLAQAAAAAISGVPGPAALALTLAAAAAWQLTPVKRDLLSRHKNPRRAPAGSVLAGGVRYGLCCLGACWCLMLVMVTAPSGQLLWLAGLTLLVTAERAAPDSGAAARAAAAALAVAAAATLAVAGLL